MRKAVLIAAVLAVLVPLGAQTFAAPTVTTAVPANSTRPVVSGIAQQGQTLTTTNGTWTNSPTSYKHRWRRCDTTGASCITISGATTKTYVVAAADVGHTLKSNVEACNASGCSGWVASAHTAVVTAAPLPSSAPHIMVVNMENRSWGDVVGNSNAPYENSLRSQYETATNYYGLGHFSLPNYLGEISGNFYSASTGDCSPGGSCSFTDQTLPQQLDSAGVPWNAFMDSMPSNCDKSDSGSYAVRHDPFVYFPAVVSADCSKIQPGANMISALNAASPPDFVFYTPNTQEDAHDTSLATGDKFLSTEIPAIQATNWYKSGGIIILTYDEGNGGTQGNTVSPPTATDGEGSHVLTVVISAATAGAADQTSYVNHFGMLAAIETAYGLPLLGQAGVSSNGVLSLPAGAAPVGQPAGTWTKLAFDDEFAGTALNTANWTTSWFGGASQNNVKTDPANVSLDGQGHLVLKLSSSTDGASVTTNPNDSGTTGHFGHGFQFGNGTYVEGRVWLPGSGTTVNDWPAFWTDGQNWPVDGETDIVEGLGTATSNYHSACAGTTNDCPNNSNTIPGTWAGGWHTYGFDRESGQNKVYWDGSPIRSYPTSDGGAQQYIIANIGAGEGPTVAGDQLKLDYVRVWQH